MGIRVRGHGESCTRLGARLLLLVVLGATLLSGEGEGFWLAWNYEAPRTNIVFEVWRSPDLKQPFQLFKVVETTNVWIRSEGGDSGFFIVRASNTVLKAYGPWNVHKKPGNRVSGP